MNFDHKWLLLKDLYARVPWVVRCQITFIDGETNDVDINGPMLDHWAWSVPPHKWCECIRPYLYPLSSMTEEDKEFLRKQDWCIALSTGKVSTTVEGYDWLNKNHFDYRGLISLGLAIDATGTDVYAIEKRR